MKKYTQISYKERISIETLIKEKRSNRYIASFLIRSPNTISLEIKKNRGRNNYKAYRSNQSGLNKRKRSKHLCLACNNKKIESFVRERIKKRWSPERISGYLKRSEIKISTKAIYKYIHTNNLDKYLFWHRNKKKSLFKNQYSFIKDDRKYIDIRPNVTEPNHFEMDFIVSSKSKTSLLVMVDKITRKVCIERLFDRSRVTINTALKKRLKNPKTITTDNDVVFQHWKQMEVLLNTKVYFTHPYHAYEKGLIENTNRWIRVFFPKYTDFDSVSNYKIKKVENYLNNIPRKVLGFKSANEVESEIL